MSISFDHWLLWWLTFNSFHIKVKSAPVPPQSTLRDINTTSRTSLVVQWIGICLSMQGTQVWSLIWEDFTCHGQLKPTCHSDWACTLKPMSSNYRACVLQLPKPTCLEPVLYSKRSHRNEKPVHCTEERPLLSATRESPHTSTKTQQNQKLHNKLLKKKTKNSQANLF